MNFLQLKTRAANLATQQGWLQQEFVPNWGELVNQALNEFSWHTEYRKTDLSITTVANQTEYTFSRDVKRIVDVIYDTSVSLLLVDDVELRRMNTTFTVSAAGVPMYYYTDTPNTISFYPKPSTSSKTITVSAIVADDELTSDTASPKCPSAFTEGVALLACYHHAKGFVKGEDYDKVKAFYKEAYDYADKLKSYLVGQVGPVMQRRTSSASIVSVSLT